MRFHRKINSKVMKTSTKHSINWKIFAELVSINFNRLEIIESQLIYTKLFLWQQLTKIHQTKDAHHSWTTWKNRNNL